MLAGLDAPPASSTAPSRAHVDDVQRDFGVGQLFLAFTQYAGQLGVALFLASEFSHIAGDGEIRTLDLRALAAELCVARDLLQILAVKHLKAAGLLQVLAADTLERR